MRKNGFFKKGFTTVELTIILAILALVVSICAPIVVRVRCMGKYKACTSNAQAICKCLEKYRDEKGYYPSKKNYSLLVEKSFNFKVPVCPVDGQPYIYEPVMKEGSSEEAKGFTLTCSTKGGHDFVGKTGLPKFTENGLVDKSVKIKQ